MIQMAAQILKLMIYSVTFSVSFSTDNRGELDE